MLRLLFTKKSKLMRWQSLTRLRSNSAFKETVRFNNIYNRMICFDSQTFHGINSFYTEKEPRLTQAFFVVSLETDSGMPLERMRRINERVGA